MTICTVYLDLIIIIFSIATIIRGIRIIKHNVFINSITSREMNFFYFSLYFLNDLIFCVDKNTVYIKGLFIGIIPLICLILYIVYIRKNNKKIIVYNSNEETIKNSLCKILNMHHIEYEEDYMELNLKNVNTYIVIIDNLVVIKKYKLINNYNDIIEYFTNSLENTNLNRKNKDAIKLILIGGCCLILIPALFYLFNRTIYN